MRFVLIALLLLCVTGRFAQAEDQIGIVAIVNEDIITTTDLNDRIALTMAMAAMPNDPKLIEQLRGQTLRSLVDERLQAQEAERLSILVERKEIEQAVRTIEKGRDRPAGSLEAALETGGLSVDSFREQIRSQIRWQKIVQRKIRREVSVGDDEMRMAQQKMVQGRSELEVKISVINVPVHDPEEEKAVQDAAEVFATRLREGASVEAIEVQLKNDPSASVVNGKWVQPTQLDKTLAARLVRMQPGQIIPPTRTFDGYQIVRFEDKRTVSIKPSNAEIAMKEILLTLGAKASKDEVDLLLQIAKDIRLRPGTCRDEGIAGMVDFDGLDIEIDYVRTELERMNGTIRDMVAPLKIGEVAEPFATPEGIRLLMLCEKIEKPLPLPDEEWVREQLAQEKLSLAAAKFMRNLRRASFVDVRI